jgi:hypothetical protein
MRLMIILLLFPLIMPAQVPRLRAAIHAVKQAEYIQAIPMLNALINSTQPIDERAAAHYYRAICLEKNPVSGADYLRAIDDYQTAGFLDKDKWGEPVQEALQELQPRLVRSGLEHIEQAKKIRHPAQKSGAIQLAMQLSKAAEQLAPLDYLPKYLQGMIHMERADYAQARRLLMESAILFQQQIPKHPDVLASYIYYRLALLHRHYLSEGQAQSLSAYREALNYLRKAREVLDSEYERARRQRGHELQRYQLQRESALADFHYLELDLLTQLPEKRAEALDKLAQALKREPNQYDLLMAYGQLMEDTDIERSIQQYMRASAVSPNRVEAHYQLGTFFYNRGVLLLQEADQTAELSRYRHLHSQVKDYFTKSRPHLVAVHHLQSDDKAILDALIQVSQYLHIAEDYYRYKTKREGRH